MDCSDSSSFSFGWAKFSIRQTEKKGFSIGKCVYKNLYDVVGIRFYFRSLHKAAPIR
jgi:hypothetical protein